MDNPYGKSKKAAEDYIFEYAKRTGAKAFVYRLPNVFGKWCRPNYNSAIATFCNNIARDLPITVNDPNVNMHVVYIDDIADEIVRALRGNPTRGDGAEIDGKFCMVPITHRAKLGEIVEMIRAFKQSRGNLEIADMTVGSLSTKLYSTYLSYLPEDDFSYPLNMHVDERGSFTEFMRTIDRGQVSVNITKPHITKGNHWHHSKNEKYIVVKGRASIRFRKVGDDKVIEYLADGENLKVVDIPTGYVHCIENIGEGDLVTIMWANEPFNPDKPDTYFEKSSGFRRASKPATNISTRFSSTRGRIGTTLSTKFSSKICSCASPTTIWTVSAKHSARQWAISSRNHTRLCKRKNPTPC